MAEPKKIILNKINGMERAVLSGRDNGKKERKTLQIDSLDSSENNCVVIIPETVFSVNSSFFGGLFQKSILTLGEEKFREKYTFECSSIIRMNIEDGIYSALYTSEIF